MPSPRIPKYQLQKIRIAEAVVRRLEKMDKRLATIEYLMREIIEKLK